METTGVPNSVVAAWLQSRNVILEFLRELRPDHDQATLEHNAAAVIARLAHHNPPLLICTPDEMKDD